MTTLDRAITEEMIDAGADRLASYDRDLDDPIRTVSEILAASLEAAPPRMRNALMSLLAEEADRTKSAEVTK